MIEFKLALIVGLLLFSIILLVWIFILYNKSINLEKCLDATVRNNNQISKIIYDDKLTNDEKVNNIKWEFDNLPF